MSRLGHDLQTSVNNRVIAPTARISFFIFYETLQFRENKYLAKNSEFTGVRGSMISFTVF